MSQFREDGVTEVAKPLTFKDAFKKLPMCLVGADDGSVKTITDLWHLARIQLDLYDEGQDGTEDMTAKDVGALRKYMVYLGGTLHAPPKTNEQTEPVDDTVSLPESKPKIGQWTISEGESAFVCDKPALTVDNGNGGTTTATFF